jgi:hypothetical protein
MKPGEFTIEFAESKAKLYVTDDSSEATFLTFLMEVIKVMPKEYKFSYSMDKPIEHTHISVPKPLPEGELVKLALEQQKKDMDAFLNQPE